jgi:hypothetical protein
MTFLEAAIAILQREGKPMHFKKLTEIALHENLLTVVGRAPEETMQQRLNEALKNDPNVLLTREGKAGVFGLRYYPPRPAAAAAVPAQAVAQPGAPADGAGAPAEERKRRRRRGGRGRRRDEREAETGGEPVEGAPPEGEEEVMPPPSAPDAGLPAPSIAAAAAEGTAQAGTAAPEGEAPAGPAASSEADTEGPAPGAGARRSAARSPFGPPERRSFAEAAAAVAAAHRELASREGVASMAPTNGLVASLPGAAPPSSSVEPPPAESASPPPVAAAAIAETGRVEEALRPGEPELEPAVWSAAAATEAEQSRVTAEPEAEGPEEALVDEDLDVPSGPLIAPSLGTEELVRGEDHRPVFEESGRGRRRGRDRRRREEKPGRHGEAAEPRAASARAGEPPAGRARAEAKAGTRAEAPRGAGRGQAPRSEERPGPGEARPAEAGARPAEARGAPPSPSTVAEGGTGPVDAAVEILRASDGRSVHARQIVEMALKRRLMRGDPAELVRVMRVAIVAEARVREAAGLRPRVTSAGGASYVLADRRLDTELAQQERELGESAARLAAATRAALQRRIAALPAQPFEAFMRLLLARLGVEGIELVKRGEGVGYFGGESAGPARRRLLIGLRPGDAPVTRRAIGELRAGLKARGFDEGLLLAAGRAAPDALAELATAGGVTLYDGETLAAQCARAGVGVVLRRLPVEVLDLELLGEVSEA